MSGMRPRLRMGISWVATETGGIHVVSGRGRASVPGADLYRWLTRLAPFLDGTHTVAELTASVPPQARAKTEQVLQVLHRHGVVEDLSQERPHTLTGAEQRTYAGQLRYLAEHTEAAGYRFERYRDTPALVIGAGGALLAVLEAVLRSGSRYVTAVVTGDRAMDRPRLDAVLAADPDRTCTVVVSDEEPLAGLVDRAGLVLHVVDPDALSRAEELDRLCAERGTVLCQAVIGDGEAWLGPVSAPDDPGSRWAAAWGRVQPAVPAPAAEPDPAITLLANRLVLRCFRHLTGIDPAAGRTLVRLDTATLSTSTHPFVPHPHAAPAVARTAAGFRERIAELRGAPEVDEAAFSRAASSYVDGRTGILTALGERHFQQLPLWVTEARTADPIGLLAARGVATAVHGAGEQFRTARHRAARSALELYASAMVDRRLLLARDGTTPDPYAPWTAGWLWGWRLDGRGEELVPAPAVFASAPRGGPQLPAGVASGSSWAAAVEAGLLRRCQALTVAGALVARRAFPAVDLDAAGLDEEGERMLGVLRIAGAPVTAYDITGPLAVPTYALYLRDQPVAHVSGWSPADALRDGLQQAVLAYQSELADEPDYRPPAVPDLPEGTRGDSPPRPIRDGDSDRAGRFARLVDALAARGGPPVAVPLDHDPGLSAALPFVVRVVVGHRTTGGA